MRLLHVRDDPRRRVAPGEEPRSRRGADPRVPRRQRLPLLHLPADRASRPARRHARVERGRGVGDGTPHRRTRVSGARRRTVGPARSRGTRLLRCALRRDGRGPVRRAERGRRVVDQQRRMDPHRGGRGRHGVHRQGRRRAGQPHGSVPAGGRGAARAVRARPAGDGRHRCVPVRHGHVRQPLDAGRRREPACDRGLRSGAPAHDRGGSVGGRRGRTRRVRRRRPRTRRGEIDQLWRARARGASGGASPGRERLAGDGMANGRSTDTEGDGGCHRDRRPAVPHRPLASRDASRPRPSSSCVRCHVAVGRYRRRAGDTRCERRPRG